MSVDQTCSHMVVQVLKGIALAVLFAAASAASSEEISVSIAERYREGSIQSVQMADAALADAGREREKVEAQFATEKQACQTKFFATSCIDSAKERRREVLQVLRAIELQANSFKRHARVKERDAALVAKREKDDAQHAERILRQQEADVEEVSPSAAVTPASQEAKVVESSQTATGDDRSARHAAKLEQIRRQEAQDAPRRAENIAAYEKKVRQVEARQKRIEEKKAEKARRRAEKESTLSGES